MKSKTIFGKAEAISLLVIITTTQLFTSFPRVIAERAGTAGWILLIYAIIISILLFVIICKMYKNFKGKDILDIGEYVGGNIGRILVGLILVVNYTFICSIVLREFSDGLKIIILERSPMSFVMFFFLLGMIVAAFYGLEPITRFSTIILPLIATAFISILVTVVPIFNIDNIFPIMGKGAYNLLINGVSSISIFSGISVIFILPPFLNSFDCFKKTGIYSILLSGFFLTIGIVVYTLSIPYPVSTEITIPMYTLARTIDLGRFFTRIESVFVLAWSTSAFIYLGIILFFIVYVFKKTFKLKYHTPLIFPMAILIFTFASIPGNMMRVFELESQVFRTLAWVVTFAMPLILLISASVIKKKKGEISNEKNS